MGLCTVGTLTGEGGQWQNTKRWAGGRMKKASHVGHLGAERPSLSGMSRAPPNKGFQAWGAGTQWGTGLAQSVVERKGERTSPGRGGPLWGVKVQCEQFFVTWEVPVQDVRAQVGWGGLLSEDAVARKGDPQQNRVRKGVSWSNWVNLAIKVMTVIDYNPLNKIGSHGSILMPVSEWIKSQVWRRKRFEQSINVPPHKTLIN